MRIVLLSTNRLHQERALLRRGTLQGLLDHIAGVLVTGQRQNVLPDDVHDMLTITRSTAMLHHMLHHIVSILIRGQLHTTLKDLIQQRRDLHRSAVFDESLDHTAAVAMLGHARCLTKEGIHDETNAIRRKSLNALLNDMVPMLVFNALQDMALQLTDQQYLLLDGNGIQRLLNHSAPVHLEGKFQDLSHQLLRQDAALIRIAILEKLLDDIVAKDVRGQLVHLLENLFEGLLFLFFGGHLQLLLDQPGAILILRDLADVHRQLG
mmetsp:Transcript_21722/g.47599  ORF Transcript_21722/g.47599 Transcript_21722/m.47599 type:complete len:265 (-) Transcript_21722:558-1352(-)